jgi:hypothetical protein
MIDMNAFDRGFWNDALTASIMEEKYLRKKFPRSLKE